jgi:hypothetical protein
MWHIPSINEIKKQKRHGEGQDVMISCHHYGINEIKNKKTLGAE